MPDSTLIAESYGSMLLAPEVPCRLVQWHTFANRQQFRPLMDRSLDHCIQESNRPRPLGWRADTRRVNGIISEDQHWLRTDRNLRTNAAGTRPVGFVSPEVVFGPIAAQHYATNTKGANAYATEAVAHRSLPDAKQWLRQALHTPAAG